MKIMFYAFKFCKKTDFTQWNFVKEPFILCRIFAKGSFFQYRIFQECQNFVKDPLNGPKFAMIYPWQKMRWGGGHIRLIRLHNLKYNGHDKNQKMFLAIGYVDMQ